MKNKIGVFVSTPVRYMRGHDQFPPEYQATLKRLDELSNDPGCPYEFFWSVLSGGLVRARNKAVNAFLKTDCKWFLPWDDDILATAEDILKLLSHKQPIVAALYCRREDTPIYVCNFLFEVTPQKNGLLQVFEVGTGLKLFHRQVFTELQRIYNGDDGRLNIAYTDRDNGEKLYGYFQQVVLDGDCLTEDYFCDFLCRRAKIGIWVDTTIKLKHRMPDGTLYPEEWPKIPGVDA